MYHFKDFLQGLKLDPKLARQLVSRFESPELQNEILESSRFETRLKQRMFASYGINSEVFDEIPEDTRKSLFSIAKDSKRIARICGLINHPKLMQLSLKPVFASVIASAVPRGDFLAASQKSQSMGPGEQTGINYTPETVVELIEQSGMRCLARWSAFAGPIEQNIVKIILAGAIKEANEPSADQFRDQLIVAFAIDHIHSSGAKSLYEV